MATAPSSVRARRRLRAAAVITAALAVSSVAGTAQAATRPFGSPSSPHSSGSFGLPINGALYNGSAAVAQLHTISTATRSASAGGALITGTVFSDADISHLTVAVDGTTATRVSVTGLLSIQLYQSATKEYYQLDTSDSQIHAALQLLQAPGAHYASEPNTQPLTNPADMIDQLYASGAPALSGMMRSEQRGLIRYQITVAVPSAQQGEFPDVATVITDRSGRLVGFSSATSDSSNGEQEAVTYGPQAVVLPDPQDVVDGGQLTRALASLRLPQALGFVAEEAYVTGMPNGGTAETVLQFRAAARTAAVDPQNGMGGIAVTVADVPDGVTLTARNPYTNAVATVRATLDGHGWVNVTDAAGKPVLVDASARSAAQRMGRQAALRRVPKI